MQAEAALPWPHQLVVGDVGVCSMTQRLGEVGKHDRGKVRYAGTNCQQPPLLGSVDSHLARHVRPWTYHTHLAAEDVQELRQLVEFQHADPPAYRSDSRVSAHGRVNRAGARLRNHGADLEESEGSA